MAATDQYSIPPAQAQLQELVASRTMDLLRQERALLRANGQVFWLLPRHDRLVLVFDPMQVNLDRVNSKFADKLSTLLHGRRVVFSNSRGLFLQIGFSMPTYAPLETIPLDLATQPTPLSLPIGTTAKGPLWVGLEDGDSFLVGGVRGMGKTGLLHGMIQALLHGKRAIVYAWDGKDNVEYLRYYGAENYRFIPMDGIQAALAGDPEGGHRADADARPERSRQHHYIQRGPPGQPHPADRSFCG